MLATLPLADQCRPCSSSCRSRRWCRGGGVGALKFLKLREEEWRTIQPAKHTIRFDATPDDSTVIELPRTPGSWSVLAYPELPLPAGTVDAVSLV